MFFSHFMLFPTFKKKKNFLYAGNIEKCSFTYSYWLNNRYRAFYYEIGNIEKCPFTYWLNGGGDFSKSEIYM